MYFTPEEVAVLEKNPIYRRLSRAQYSSISVATLQDYIDGVVTPGVENLPLIKYLLYLLKAKENEQNATKLVGIDADTNNIQTASSLMQYTTQNIPTFTSTSTTATPLIYKHRRIGLVAFTSDAAGNLAADVELVPLLASYYGCIEWKGLFSVGNAGGAATLVIHGNAALETLVSGTLVAGQLDTANKGMILQGDADAQNIVIDTTSAGLGNTQSYKAVFEYWYET